MIYMVNNDNISRAVYNLGELLAEKLQDMGVNASADDGLTTLANKILDINGIKYDNYIAYVINESDSTDIPSQIPFQLKLNGELVTGGLWPQNTNTTINVGAYENIPSINVQVPLYDLDGNVLSYDWETVDISKFNVPYRIYKNNDNKIGLHFKTVKDTYIESNMRGAGQNARMFYGYLLDENDNPLENKTITISVDDFGGSSITTTTGKCGYFQESQGGQNGMGASVKTVTATISFEGDSEYNGCIKTMTILTVDDITMMKTSAISGNVNNDILTITKVSYVDTQMGPVDIEDWTVELYDEQDQYITSLTESNNTYTPPSTPCTIKAVYDVNCAERIAYTQNTFIIG